MLFELYIEMRKLFVTLRVNVVILKSLLIMEVNKGYRYFQVVNASLTDQYVRPCEHVLYVKFQARCVNFSLHASGVFNVIIYGGASMSLPIKLYSTYLPFANYLCVHTQTCTHLRTLCCLHTWTNVSLSYDVNAAGLAYLS